MKRSEFLVIFLYIICTKSDIKGEIRRFPENFSFGVATASYQIEGGWNASDKSESIWDRLTHTTDLIKDGSTGDIACDSYHQSSRDVELLQDLGVNHYRFSLSWSRLLPEGFANKVSDDGFAYYDRLLDELLAANIEPMVTLYHWDLPQRMQDLGGWSNPMIVDYITDYADVAFELFGNKVKTWITINEPWVVCVEGYGGVNKAPILDMSGIADYVCAHHTIKAHASIYHLYNDKYKSRQNGRVSLSIPANWIEPETDSPEDKEAAEKGLEFSLGWFANPIFSKDGDYPEVMKQSIAMNSAQQGYPRSRLPEFTPAEIDYIKGTYDFFGLNHYTTLMAKQVPYIMTFNFIRGLAVKSPSYWEDIFIYGYQDESWPPSASDWLKVVPWGFTKLLKWIKERYDNPEVIITENGFSDRNGTDDGDRINYYNQYLNAMLDAIEDGCNVSGYTAWSLMDNFEWMEGYTERFGLHYVDFNDPIRPRTPKESAFYYKEIISSKSIERSLHDCNESNELNPTCKSP